jgi:hypothetical protein
VPHAGCTISRIAPCTWSSLRPIYPRMIDIATCICGAGRNYGIVRRWPIAGDLHNEAAGDSSHHASLTCQPYYNHHFTVYTTLSAILFLERRLDSVSVFQNPPFGLCDGTLQPMMENRNPAPPLAPICYWLHDAIVVPRHTRIGTSRWCNSGGIWTRTQTLPNTSPTAQGKQPRS